MSNKPISLAQIWNHTICVRCQKQIKKGEPRAIVMLAELGIGPGHREYQDAVEYGDDDAGLLGNYHAFAMCRPCSGEDPQIVITNPWFEEREEKCAPGIGGSVRAIPASQLKVPYGDLEFDHTFPGGGAKKDKEKDKHRRGTVAAARTEAEDRFLSVMSEEPVQPGALTQDDQRYRMGRYLLTIESRRMRPAMRKVLELWANGKLQGEIATETQISQATVSRIIRDGKSLVYSLGSKN